MGRKTESEDTGKLSCRLSHVDATPYGPYSYGDVRFARVIYVSQEGSLKVLALRYPS